MPAHLHTINLYKFDDVVSALQKSIRRCDVEQALFWAGELEQGFVYILYSRLWTIVTEDIGLAAPFLVVDVFPLYQKWLKIHKTDTVEAKKLTMRIVYSLAVAPKNRIVDNLYLITYFKSKPSDDWQFQLPQKELREKIEHLFSVNLFATQEKKEIDVQAALMQFAASLEQEDTFNAFFFCNFINLSIEECTYTPWLHQYLGIPKGIKVDSKTAKKMGAYTWYVLFEMSKEDNQLLDLLKRLYQLYISKVGSQGLVMAFAILLYCNRGRLEYQAIEVVEMDGISQKLQDLFYNNALNIHKRRQYHIPDYAIDKHTDRGKGSNFAPHNIVDLHTESQKKKIPTYQWSEQEVSKSHGAYKLFADYPRNGKHSRISHFFIEGALLKNVPTNWQGEDPYEAAVRSYFLSLEKKYGYKACSGYFIFEKMRPIWLKNQDVWLSL
jgi:hypothetical protein